MATIKISQLPGVSALSDGDLFPIVNEFETKNVALSSILDFATNKFFSLSGGTITGDLTVNGIISATGGNSNQWNSNYTTTNTNSSYWSEAYTNLVNNSATYLQGGGGGPENVYTLSSFETTLSASQYSIFVKTVTGENVFTYNNFVSGRTITVYLSSNHSGVVGHYFPVGTYFAKNGNSNLLYSFSGCVTRASIQNIGDSYQATTEVIPYNVSQYVKAGDYLLIETGMSFLSQQDDSRILLE